MFRQHILLAIILIIVSDIAIGQKFTSLTIKVNVTGVDVFLDKRKVGVINDQINLIVAPGKHEIYATKHLYKPFNKFFVCKIDQTNITQIEMLYSTTSYIILSASSKNTFVTIDDQNKITLPDSVTLESGTHNIVFSEIDKAPASTVINIQPNKIYSLSAKLLMNSELPPLNATDIGRTIREEVSFQDELKLRSTTTKGVPERNQNGLLTMTGIGGVTLGLITFGITGLKGEIALPLGLIVAYGISYMILAKQLPDYDNIKYNSQETDRYNLHRSEVESQNQSIKEYNAETVRLIKDEQNRRYFRTAISINEMEL